MSIGTGSITVANAITPKPPGERSIISRIVDRIRTMVSRGAGWVSPLMAAHGWSDPRWWTNDLDDMLPVVTELTAMGLPPFGRGVELISSTVAGVDLVGYRYDKTDQIDVRLDPQPELLRDPDLISTPWNWKYAIVNDLILYGNHFAFLGEFNAEGWPRSLYPIPVESIDYGIDRDPTSPTYGRLFWRVDGEVYPFGSIFHISAGNRSGMILGRGIIQQYRDSLSGVLSTDAHSANYFRRGGLPSAVIRVDDPDLSPETAKGIKDAYETAMSGNRRRPLVIPKIYEFTPVVSDAEKQQLVEARTWDAQLVAMILGIPAHYLNLPGTSMTYQNIEQADIGFVRDTVDRWAKPIEASVTKWLLPYGQTSRFDWSGRMRTDSKTRAEVLDLEIDAGITTVDEGRRMLHKRPLTEAEKPQTPPALVPFTGQQADQDQEPEPEEIGA